MEGAGARCYGGSEASEREALRAEGAVSQSEQASSWSRAALLCTWTLGSHSQATTLLLKSEAGRQGRG